MLTLKDKSIHTILCACPVGILISDKQGNIVFGNDTVLSIFGYTHETFCTLSIERLIPERLRHRHPLLRHEFDHDPVTRPMGKNRRLVGLIANNTEIPIEIGLSQIVIEDEQYTMVTIIDCSLSDRIKQLEAVNQQLKLAATHDYLTGLANRRLFVELADKLVGLAVRDQHKLAFMFIDLDNFKQVNDKFGHDVGDLLLIEVANVLQKHVRQSDVVSRIGGDEFLIFFNHIHSHADVSNIAQYLLEGISSINAIDGHPIDISASIGVIFVEATECTPIPAIIRQADQAMYSAKSLGKGQIVYRDYQ